MQKIKVLQIINGLPREGAQKVILDLSYYLDKTTFDVTVVSMLPLTEMVPDFEKRKIKVKVLDMQKSLYSFWITFRSLSRFIQAENIQIVHAHLFHSGLMTTLLKIWFPAIKFVFTPHTFNLEAKTREWIVKQTKFLRQTDILFSDEMKNAIYRKDALIIPNGIRVKDYEIPVAKFPIFTFLAIGRLGPEKNHQALIEPIKQLKAKGHKCQLLIAGKGPLKAELQQAINENGLEEEIILLGQRKDIPSLCNQAHCLVHPSLWEGLPIVLLEAGASQLPIIATNVGSIATLVNEETGYLLPHIDQLTSTMETVLTEYKIAEQKAAKLKQRLLEQFDINAIVRQHETLYLRLISTTKEKELVSATS